MAKLVKNLQGKPVSQRQLKVSESIKRTLGLMFVRGDLSFSFDTAFISVTEVKISPDLRNATVYVRSLNLGDSEKPTYIKELNQNKSQLRYLLARRLKLQFSTDLFFVYDTTLSRTAKIDALIQQAQGQVFDV